MTCTPGAARPCPEVQRDVFKRYELARRHSLCAVITLAGADVFIGVSAPGAATPEMNRDAIIFTCANPTPEIFPEDAKTGGAAVISVGRGDFPNRITNVLTIPGIFRGAFDVRANDINKEIKMTAAQALAGFISDGELSAEYIVPKAFGKRAGPAVAKPAADAVRRSGVARI